MCGIEEKCFEVSVPYTRTLIAVLRHKSKHNIGGRRRCLLYSFYS